MKLQLITMAHPCTACVILCNLSADVMHRLQKQYPQVECEFVTLHHPREMAQVEGLEVEKLPALLIDGEQVTAGSLPDRRAIAKMIETQAVGDSAL